MARVTIEDVAKATGVAIATVSRFINGHSGAMSDPTRLRIPQAVERLGSMPNSAAQALKTGRSKLIGMVLTEIARTYTHLHAPIGARCQPVSTIGRVCRRRSYVAAGEGRGNAENAGHL